MKTQTPSNGRGVSAAQSSLLASSAAILCLGAAISAPAALTTYHDEASFVGVLSGNYLHETFADLTPGTLSSNQFLTFINGPFVVLSVLTTDGLWASQDPATYGRALSAETFNTDVTLDLPTKDVLAFGGWFFLTDQDDKPVSGAITVTITTETGSSDTTFTTAGSGTPEFLGWTSDVAIWSVTLASDVGAFNTAGNIYASPAVIPEPATAAMLAASAAFGTALAKRRRANPTSA